MLRTLMLTATLIAFTGGSALATCYRCTNDPPHICYPAPLGQHGWQECYDGPTPDEPCEVNWQTGCTGGSGTPGPMLATRSLVLFTDPAWTSALFAGQPFRMIRGQGADLSPGTVRRLLELEEEAPVTLAGSYFSLGDADLVRSITAVDAQGFDVRTRDSFRGAVFSIVQSGMPQPLEFRVRSGDLALVPAVIEGRSAIVALATERISPDHPALMDHLTAIQLRFKVEAAAWGSPTEPELLANR
jgi:hypothetical protein